MIIFWNHLASGECKIWMQMLKQLHCSNNCARGLNKIVAGPGWSRARARIPWTPGKTCTAPDGACYGIWSLYRPTCCSLSSWKIFVKGRMLFGESLISSKTI
ncbi:unnamed protein product [Amoebophrya sp. A120]|nr:unnamed protein product [Amoebophrya sp. A120]|eukprot:GSA120T00020698001.1